MATIRRFGVLVLTAGLLVCVTGCSGYYYFILFCDVRNADDGTPLEGVQAVFDEYGQADRLDDRVPLEETTGPDGILYRQLKVTHVELSEDRRWLLKLTKEGFHPEVVDISPSRKPKGWGEANAWTSPRIVDSV